MSDTRLSAEAVDPPGALPEGISRILDLLICPYCDGGLDARTGTLDCSACEATYPIVDEIALLAREGTSETWTGREASVTSAPYQAAYKDNDPARGYNEAYRDRFWKRRSTEREFKLLRQLLGSQPRSATLLDIPCGGGRLSPQLEPFADLMIEADVGLGQLRYARSMPRARPPAWMTASAFHVPLRDDAVDAVVCVRLCHHLPTATERERLIAELLRVASRFVVMTFFDFDSVKNRLRRANPFNRKPPKLTMTVDQVRRQAHQHGAELVACPSLFTVSSGHRYALMVK